MTTTAKTIDATERFEAFIARLKKSDRTAILYHNDGDGVCAATIAAKSLERLERPPVLVMTQRPDEVFITAKTIQKLRRGGVTKLIVLDMDIDCKPQTVKNVEKFARILILDHHIILEDLNSRATTMIKAAFVSDIPQHQYCVAKLAYDLFSRVILIEDLDWIAAVGIVADKGTNAWKEFLREAADRHAVNVKRFEEIDEILEAARCCGGSPKERFEVLHDARGIADVLNSPLSKYREAFSKELDYLIRTHRRAAEFYPELRLIWYEIAPKIAVKTRLANMLSDHYPNWTVIAVTKNEKSKKADVSARRQDCRISMHELMQVAASKIKGAMGGGHIPAAGATVPAESLADFKARIIELLREKTR